MRKVCLAFQVLLLSSWVLNVSLLGAQTSSTSAVGHQRGGVDHGADRRRREDEQFSATEYGNSSEGIVIHRDEGTRTFLLPLNLNLLPKNFDVSTQITNSLNNNLFRNERSQVNCVLDEGGEMFHPGTVITFKSLSTTLHVQASKPFRLDIDVSVSQSFDRKLTVSSESLGISRDDEWNSIDITLSLYWEWKLEVKHGDTVKKETWFWLLGSVFNSMTITVTDCIKWYSGVKRHTCQSPTTVTTSSRPTTPNAPWTTTPATTPPTVPSETGLPSTYPAVPSETGLPSTPASPTSNPSSDEERGQAPDIPDIVSEHSVDPLYWLLVLPLVAVVAVAVTLGCLQKRKNNRRKAAIALALEAAIQPRVRHESINSLYGVVARPVQRHESINSLYESSDLQLNPACGTGTWGPSSRDCSGSTLEENIYEN